MAFLLSGLRGVQDLPALFEWRELRLRRLRQPVLAAVRAGLPGPGGRRWLRLGRRGAQQVEEEQEARDERGQQRTHYKSEHHGE